jgi:GMP synthase-like glutamine amidotransferase
MRSFFRLSVFAFISLTLAFALANASDAAAPEEDLQNAYPIIYGVEYGPKPPSPPSLQPVWRNSYLKFDSVYLVVDNWYYASRERADSIEADAFLIKGGSTSDVPFYDGRLDSYVELLKNPGRPTMGFCAGHQFLQMARGGICARRSGEHGYQTATIFGNDEILEGCPNPYTAYAAHNYSITDIPDCYVNLAVTRTCYSTFVRHITMPLYGTQLHIENTSYPSAAGPVIIGNFRNIIMQRKFHGVAEVVGFPGEPGKVNLTWWKAKTDEGVLYQVYHSTDEGGLDYSSPDYETTELEYEIEGLDPDVLHYFGVRAVSSAFEDSNRTVFPIRPDGHRTIVFQNGLPIDDQVYDDCAATVIYHQYPNSNYGGRGSAAPLYWWDAGLVQFKGLEAYLAGKKIVGGKMTYLFAGGVEDNTNSSHTATIAIYQILRQWNEGRGADHVEALDGEATWNSARHNMDAWEVPGCRGISDRAFASIQSRTIKGDGTGISFDGTVALPPALLQSWVDNPATNCGLQFEKFDTYPDDTYFIFEDNDDDWFMNHPRLTIHYVDASVTAVEGDDSRLVPASVALSQNYPNPFNPATTIQYEIPEMAYVTLKVFNALGEEIATLVERPEEAGYRSVAFDGARLASGVYFYRLTVGESVTTRKMMLVR